MSASKLLGGACVALVLSVSVTVSNPTPVSASALASMHTQGMVNGRMCMLNHAHKRNGRSNVSVEDAKRQAVAKWISYTQAEYGSKWSNFHASWDKKMQCNERRGGLSSRFKCRLSAKPCKAF